MLRRACHRASVLECGSPMPLFPPARLKRSAIHIFFEGAPHGFDWSGLASPDFESFCPLVEEHADAVRSATACVFGGLEKQRLCRAIDHVIDGFGTAKVKLIL